MFNHALSIQFWHTPQENKLNLKALLTHKVCQIALGSALCVSLLGLSPVSASRQASAVAQQPQFSLAQATPTEQIQGWADSFDIPAQKLNASVQSQVVQQLLVQEAAKYGVPRHVALALAGHESHGWQMWSAPEHAEVLVNTNRNARGELHSHDWGVMQINDSAHPQAFPQAATDLQFNIQYGLAYLASLHDVAQASYNWGFGRWDGTLAAYHLGHRPRPHEQRRAQKYVSQIRRFAQRTGLIQSFPYVIQEGDTLGKIALKQWGDAGLWPQILAANPSMQLRPQQLRQGQTIQLPFAAQS